MTPVSYNPGNHLPDDVLLVIFNQLDEEDWVQCETVCRQWRKVLLSGTPWRRLFHRKIVSSPQWRQVWREFGVDEKKLETAHYRGLCRAMIKEVNEIDRNWRTGICEKTTKIVNDMNYGSQVVRIGKSCIARYSTRGLGGELRFLDRTSLDVKSSIDIPDGWFATTNTEIVVLWDKKSLKILDINGQLMSEVPELSEDERVSWNLALCCLSDDQMAVISQTDGQEKLSLWDVSDPSKVTRLNSRYLNLDLDFSASLHIFNWQLNFRCSMKMDDQFIVVSTFPNNFLNNFLKITTNFYFFSKKTLDLHWQKTVDGYRTNFAYDQGMFPISVVNRGFRFIEMYDVASRNCFRQMCMENRNLNEYIADFNSKFMVVVGRTLWKTEYGVALKMYIYDLEAVKYPESTEEKLLVHTLEVKTKSDFLNIMMSETETFIICFNEIIIFDFGSLECFRNESKSVTLSSPWCGVWRSKGVDEEPLEPLHHMEVYTEVVKYFHQLSLNCRTAMECYPVVDLKQATLTLGDNFIGYRQGNGKMMIYDENMDGRSCETCCNAVLISKNTCVSVMNKTIQLIDIVTGKIINEVKLEREVKNWHFNCNLLVAVRKIREDAHLLSVWRVEDSLNLIHLKDVPIGDCYALFHDEQFTAVRTSSQENAGNETIFNNTYNFISMKTFQEERALSSRERYLAYDKGYLFLLKNDTVRILDVASGTFLRDIRMEPTLVALKIRVNSNYVVISTIDHICSSKLHVYDLNCLKETDAVPSHLRLTSIDLQYSVAALDMTETRIVCLNSNTMYVVDLKPIDRLRCPEYN